MAVVLLLVGAVVAGVLVTRHESDVLDADRRAVAAASTAIPVGVSFGATLQGLTGRQLAQTLDQVVAMHATWIRVDLSWSALQPDGPDTWSWTSTGRVLAAAHERGLHVLGLLTYTPGWARDPGCPTWSCPPADPEAFARFARTVAERSGRYGVDTFEIWNEPNLTAFWEHPDPTRYGDLLAAGLAALREERPGVRVLLGGLTALPTADGVVAADTFVREACSEGRCAGIDGVGYHPYTFPNLPSAGIGAPNAWRRMTSGTAASPGLQTAVAAVGLDVPVWVTEFGAPTGGSAADGARPVTVSDQRQAEILVDGLRRALAERTVVGGYFVHTWQDRDTDGSTEDHFGIRTVTGAPKPAYTALRRALAP